MVLKSVLAAASAILVGTAAQALTIVPISAVGSSSYNGYADSLAIDVGPGSLTTDWASNSQGTSSTLDLDLGAIYTLATVSVIDRVTSGAANGAYAGGTTDFTTSYSLQAYTDASFTTTSGAALVFFKSTPVGPTGVSSFLDTQSATGLVGQYFKYSVLASNGANAGLANISFDGTSAIPEPAVWGLMIAGFAMTGFAARRRRQTVVAA